MGSSTVLGVLLERVRFSSSLDEVWVATTDEPRDDAVAGLAAAAGLPVHRGSEHDVLRRFAGAASASGAGTVVRLTADCPLVGPGVVDLAVEAHAAGGADLTTNAPPTGRSWPDGLDVEVFDRAALDELDATVTDHDLREHVTAAFHRCARWRVRVLRLDPDLGSTRITIDTPQDLERVRSLLALLEGEQRGDGVDRVLEVLRRTAPWALPMGSSSHPDE